MLKVSMLSDVLKIRSTATYAKSLLLTFRHLPPYSSRKYLRQAFKQPVWIKFSHLSCFHHCSLCSSLCGTDSRQKGELSTLMLTDQAASSQHSNLCWPMGWGDVWAPHQGKRSHEASAYPQCPEIIQVRRKKKNNKTLHLEGRGNEDRKLEFILNPISKGWGFKKREQVLQENRDDNTPTKAIIHMYSLEYII